MKYHLKNRYQKKGSTHYKLSAAIKAKDSREGIGWYVVDDNGNEYDVDFDGNIVISEVDQRIA